MTSLTLYDLPAQIQDEARFLREQFQRITASGKPVRQELLKLAEDGRSLPGLYRLLKSWKNGGDIALVDKRPVSKMWKQKRTTKLPKEFLQWAGGQILGNQRKSRPAYREIIRRWNRWRKTGDPVDAIPGYATPPLPGRKGYPDGWSYRSLMRLAQPNKAELTIARQGTAAARAHLPSITGTREGLRWLEWVYFDDVWHDRKCIVPGYMQPVRILQLGCLDHATGLYLKFGLRPDLPRDDGTRDRLKRRDMLMVVASMLMQYGYPTDYVMHMVVERATATLTLAEAKLLFDLSGGQIQVGYTSMDGTFVLAWDEASSGNARGKGPLESWHNLFHNELASLPGQVGKDRNHSPASLMGSDREAVALNKANLLLPAEYRGSIQSPYPTLPEAHAQSLAVVERINSRHDHKMEGFASKTLWRLKGSATDFAPEEAMANIDPSLESSLEWIMRPESPAERALRLSAQTRVAFIPNGALVRFYEDSHFSTCVKNRQASVSVKGKSLCFGPDEAEQMKLDEGTRVYLHFNPLDPSFALVTGDDGVFIDLWPRQLVARGNSAALAQGMRRKQSFLNASVSQVRGKMAEQMIREERRMDANLSALASADIIPDSSFLDCAEGRKINCTPIAEGMQRAIEGHRASAQEQKDKVRKLRSFDAGELLEEAEEAPLEASIAASFNPEDLLD